MTAGTTGRIHALAATLAALALTGIAQAQHGAQHMHRQFDDAERWSRVFDDPARDAWQKPAAVLEALELREDMAVADVGAGTGYFAVRLARAVPRGKVYAADLSADMVAFLRSRATREGLPNLEAVHAAEDSPRLPAAVDRVLMVDTYHHIGTRTQYFAALRASLKPGARVAIVDFTLDSPTGPPRRHRVPPEQVREELAAAGYRLVAQRDGLPYQYLLVFEAPAAR